MAMSIQQQAKAIRLLRLIDAEWRTDPMSVQCFDLRIVSQTRELLKALDADRKPENKE